MIKSGNETILNKSPPPLIHEEHLRHDYNPSACSDFIHITGTAIHIALETLIHITGIRNQTDLGTVPSEFACRGPA
jgi:hypothetical protein